MEILPAIDLKDGKAVRLYQGDFSKQTIVNAYPLEQAKLFAKAGLTYLHVVDLDGALEKKAVNANLIAQLKQESQMKVEVGGGIRTMDQIKAYLEVGIDRVILGSMAAKEPLFVREAIARFGAEQIVVGIDAKNGQVAIEGWQEVTALDYIELAKQLAEYGAATFIYTDVAKDGTLSGPNFDHYRNLTAALPNCQIIASGGIHSKEDLIELAQLGVVGAIVGKAYYSGALSLEDLAKVNGGAQC
ncbi:1-(5-phosphoribosyl)-5-[(5-phosphoribosylamino)methylideneamino]imidazole-4-carboxamide isomerase [Enterococcus bulliens]